MSDDTGSTAPRRPAPDPFYLAVAHELGLDPGRVIDGTMRLEWDDGATLRGRTGQVRIELDRICHPGRVDLSQTVAEAQGLRDDQSRAPGTIAETQGDVGCLPTDSPTDPGPPNAEVGQIKVRPSAGGCYYIDDQPQADGLHHGVSKYTDCEAHLRWDADAEDWIVVWEGEMNPLDLL